MTDHELEKFIKAEHERDSQDAEFRQTRQGCEEETC